MTANTPSSKSLSRIALPSITDLIFILLLLSLTYGRLAPRLLADGDVGWHIRNGENILATHAIPRVDVFSATKNGQTWYSWEWLYDLVVGWIHAHAGLNGVVLLSALIIAFTLSLVFRLTLRRGGALPIAILTFTVCLVASSIHFLARPHLVTWAFVVAWFWALDQYERGKPAGLVWFFPSLMMIWVNLHGGFVLGFVLLGIFLVGAIAEYFTGRDTSRKTSARARAAAIASIAICCGVASLINPYSYKLHLHVYEYLTNRFYMQHIDEFRAPNLHGLPAQAFVLLLVIALFGLWKAKGKVRLSGWLVMIFSGFSGLWAARNIPIASMLLMMETVPLFTAQAADSESRLNRLSNWESQLKAHFWPAIAVLASLGICVGGGSLFHKQLMHAHFDESRFPVRAVQKMAQEGIKQPVFTLDSWGGYFIYSRYPEQQVFVDDRHDFYGEPYLREYLRVLHLESGWQEVLDRWGVQLIVFPPKANLSRELSKSGWKTVYEDDTAAVFLRH